MKDFGEAYVQRQEQRTNLTSGQHILHLLLTVFTGGLWIPVWIIRSAQGNRRPQHAPIPPYAGPRKRQHQGEQYRARGAEVPIPPYRGPRRI